MSCCAYIIAFRVVAYTDTYTFTRECIQAYINTCGLSIPYIEVEHTQNVHMYMSVVIYVQPNTPIFILRAYRGSCVRRKPGKRITRTITRAAWEKEQLILPMTTTTAIMAIAAITVLINVLDVLPLLPFLPFPLPPDHRVFSWPWKAPSPLSSSASTAHAMQLPRMSLPMV